MAFKTSVPVQPDRDEARELLERELSDPQYDREFSGPLREAIDDFFRWLRESTYTIGGVEFSWGPLLVMLLIIAAIVLCVLLVRPRLQRSKPEDQLLETEAGITADQLRARADEHLAAGHVDEAYRDRYRALVRAAEERDILPEQPGRTATEAAIEMSQVFSIRSEPLHHSAERFNLSRYGGRSLQRADYQALVALDDELTAMQPAEHSADYHSSPQVVAPR